MPIEPIAQPVAASSDTLLAVAGELARAEADRSPIGPITVHHPEFGLADAYRIQRINIERRLGQGAVLIGHKVGLTNVAMQAQLGVDEPDFGHLLDDMGLDDEGTVADSAFITPRIEPEIAFLIGRDLIGPGTTAADVLAATDALAPALEIIDSRIADWKIKLVDTVADNASSARVVVGPRSSPHGVDLIALQGQMLRDGEVVGAGVGAAVLGDPAAAVAWLVNTLAQFGESLRAGEIVIPGALTASVPLNAGAYFRAEIDGLGGVGIRVVP